MKEVNKWIAVGLPISRKDKNINKNEANINAFENINGDYN